jgi:sugar phosphate isomerase/epimerase
MHTLRQSAQIGIVFSMAYPEVGRGDGPVLDRLQRLLTDDYFDVIEMMAIADPGVAAEAAAMLREAHVATVFGAGGVLMRGGYNLNALDTAARLAAVDAVRAYFDQAALLGATGVGVLSGPCPADARQAGTAALIDSLIRLSTAAAGYGMRFMLEVFDTDIEKRALVGHAPLARQVGAAVRAQCPNFGLLHDSSHMPLLGESPAAALEPIADLLVHMHIGNAVLADTASPAYGDQHPRFGYPGSANGVDDVAELLRVLYRIGYLGGPERRTLSFEIKPQPGESSARIIAGAKRVLNAAAARVHKEDVCAS